MNEEPVDGWIGLIETARRVGHHVWIERELFAWLGAWSNAEGVDPAVTVFLGEQASRHGRQAEVLFARLPQLRELETAGLIVPRDDATEAFVHALSTPGEPDALLGALVDQYRVLLPTLVASYRALAAGASPVSDASLIRSLAPLIEDHVDGWARGDALLRTQLRSAEDLRRALDRQRESEARLLGFQGSLG